MRLPSLATAPVSGTPGVDRTRGLGVSFLSPGLLALEGAFPNPFYGQTAIRFVLGESAEVDASLYDAQGRRVRALAPRRLAAGRWTMAWDGRDDAGGVLAAGVYFYRLEARSGPMGDAVATGKVALGR